MRKSRGYETPFPQFTVERRGGARYGTRTPLSWHDDEPIGAYVAIGGWLECDDRQLAAIREITAAHDDGHYSNGWGSPRRHVSWTRYVFFGADVAESAGERILEQVRAIAAIQASDSDSDGDRATGLFFTSYETAGMHAWQIRDGQVSITSGENRYRYLDA